MKTFYGLVTIPYPMIGMAAGGLPGAGAGLMIGLFILFICAVVFKNPL
jgi:hypothetical protein